MATDPTGRISHIADMHRGLTWKPACRAATTATITISTALNSGDTIDGVTLATGDRVLVKNQSTPSQNGIYIVGATPTRAADMDQDTTTTTIPAEEIAGAVVFVISGTTNTKTIWYTTNAVGGTVGSTSIVWAQFTGAGTSNSGLHWFNVTDVAYGAANDGSTDDTSAINAAIAALNAAGKGVLYFPAGTGYKVTAALTTITAAGTVLGDGAGSTTGAASTITCTSGSVNLFTFRDGITFRGLRIVNSAATPSAGSALLPTTGYGLHTRYEDLWVEGFYVNVDHSYGGEWSMENCHLSNPILYGMRIRNLDLPDGGDWSMSDVWIGTRSRNATSALRIESAGGGKIANLKVNCNSAADQTTFSGTFRYSHGIDLAVSSSVATADLLISSTSIENVTGDGVHGTTSSGTSTWRTVMLTGVQIGLYGTNTTGHAVSMVSTTAADFSHVIIDGCSFYGAASNVGAAIVLTSVDRARIGDVRYEIFGSLLSATTCTNLLNDSGALDLFWSSGTSFPSSPVTDQRFTRTDRERDYYYDGTRWLTTQEFSVSLGLLDTLEPFGSSPGNDLWGPTDLAENGQWITRTSSLVITGATNTGSAYWSFQLKSLDSASSAHSIGSAFDTSADSANVRPKHTVTVGAGVTAGDTHFVMIQTKTGAPTNVYVLTQVFYRLIG